MSSRLKDLVHDTRYNKSEAPSDTSLGGFDISQNQNIENFAIFNGNKLTIDDYDLINSTELVSSSFIIESENITGEVRTNNLTTISINSFEPDYVKINNLNVQFEYVNGYVILNINNNANKIFIHKKQIASDGSSTESSSSSSSTSSGGSSSGNEINNSIQQLNLSINSLIEFKNPH